MKFITISSRFDGSPVHVLVGLFIFSLAAAYKASNSLSALRTASMNCLAPARNSLPHFAAGGMPPVAGGSEESDRDNDFVCDAPSLNSDWLAIKAFNKRSASCSSGKPSSDREDIRSVRA